MICRAVLTILSCLAPISLSAEDCNRNGIADEADLQAILDFEFREPAGFVLEMGPVASNAPAVDPAGRSIPLDLDDDGASDLALVHSSMPGRATLLYGDGSGAFSGFFDLEIGDNPRQVLATDFDGDGLLDLAVVDAGISILTNQGDRTLAMTQRFSVGLNWASISSGDLDGDGDAEVAMVTFNRALSIWKNDGRGAFWRRTQLTVSEGAQGVTAGDLDGDGLLDLAVAETLLSTIAIHLARGGGTFAEARRFPVESPYFPWSVDLDGDGHVDLAAYGAGARWLLWSRGGGDFEEAVSVPVGIPLDLEGDGDPDLAHSDFEAGKIRLFLNGGRRDFLPARELPLGGNVLSLDAADFDRDGDQDLAVLRGGTVALLLNRSLPSRSRDNNRNRVPDECEGNPFRRADANADGQADLSDVLFLLIHLAAGGAGPSCLKSADFDDSGSLSIIDPVFLLESFFRQGRLPGEPFRVCGGDPTEDALTCSSYPPCQ